ncbi:hypothetical protein ES703_101448 [subsurface metagenome]
MLTQKGLKKISKKSDFLITPPRAFARICVLIVNRRKENLVMVLFFVR